MVDPGETIKRILAVHPAIRKTELEMAAADALVSGSRAQPNPVLALAVSAGDAGENANYLAQNFEISGQPRLRYEQALARLEAARAQLRAARRQVAGEVCRAWLELYESGQLVRLAELRSELMAEMSRVARRRYEVGEIPRNESLRVELAEAEATAEREKARAANQAAIRSFQLLLDMVPEEEPPSEPPRAVQQASARLEDLFTAPSLGPEAGSWTLEEVLAAAQDQPEVVAMRKQQEATFKEAQLIAKERAPVVGLQIYQSQLFGQGIERGAQLAFSFPLFDWGSIDARRRSQEATAQAQLAAVEDKVLDLRTEVAGQWNRLRAAQAVRDILTEQARRYQELASKARVGYDLGMLTLTDVLQTETAFRQAGVELVRAQTDVYRLELDLLERTNLPWPKNLLEDL